MRITLGLQHSSSLRYCCLSTDDTSHIQVTGRGEWQLFISQIRLIKTYGHEGMRDTFSLVCVQND